MKLKNFLIQSDSNILQAIGKVKLNSHRAVFVTNKKNKIIGVISEGDILNALIEEINLRCNVKKIMNKSFTFLTTDDKLKAKLLFKKKIISAIPVVDKNMKVKKIITIDKVI